MITLLDDIFVSPCYGRAFVRHAGAYRLSIIAATPPPFRVQQSVVVSVFCGWVGLSASISLEPHVQSSPNFLCMLPIRTVVAWSVYVEKTDKVSSMHVTYQRMVVVASPFSDSVAVR